MAAAPLVLMAHQSPEKYQLAFFADHDAAFVSLGKREADILCSGFTEFTRLGQGAGLHRMATFVWGLSAVLVRDPQHRDFHSLIRNDLYKFLLPFARSPLDLQMRALVKNIAPKVHAELINIAGADIITRFQQGDADAVLLPEPVATLLCAGGKAHRLANLAEIWHQEFAEKMTPQVSCYCLAGFEERAAFLADLQIATAQIAAGKAQIAPVATVLGHAAAIIEQALRHVIYAVPPEPEAARLENAYSKILDSL